MAGRFVILLHVGHGEDHYDLMLARGGALATWRLSSDPADIATGQSVPARRLADHRRAYLTYEGPVSGGRGRVGRREEGSYHIITRREGCWVFRLEGERLKGTFELRRSEQTGHRWDLIRQAD